MAVRPWTKVLLVLLFAVVLGLAFYKNGAVLSVPAVQSLNPITITRGRDLSSPHLASWNTWFHPLQSLNKAGSKPASKEWNVLQHLGGNGPWIEKSSENHGSSIAPPEGCSVDQVHLVGF